VLIEEVEAVAMAVTLLKVVAAGRSLIIHDCEYPNVNNGIETAEISGHVASLPWLHLSGYSSSPFQTEKGGGKLFLK